MANSKDRFYLMEMKNRSVFHGDIGSLIQIEGLVVGGGGAQAILLMQDSPMIPYEVPIYKLNPEEWSEYIQRSDDPEILVGDAKVFHRKVRYQISGSVQQKVWTADGFKCMYCGAKMGEQLMTIDHFVPLEMGGKNDTSNYLSACRGCNKEKGSQDPFIWCANRNLDPNKFVDYLKNRAIR